MGHAECTIKDVISSKDHDGLKLLIRYSNHIIDYDSIQWEYEWYYTSP